MKIFRSILSVLLIPVILFASTGFSVNRHYCMGMMVEENFYSVVEGCAMIEMERSYSDHCEPQMESKHCCADESVSIVALDIQETGKFKQLLKLISPAWQTPEILSHSFDLVKSTSSNTLYAPNAPPIRNEDILILVQRFLI